LRRADGAGASSGHKKAGRAHLPGPRAASLGGVSGVLVLWDVDYTLVNAGGLGTRLYEAAFREMFGREMPAVPPKAGRTDRAITLDTLALAGIARPRTQVEPFLAELARQVAALENHAASPSPHQPSQSLPPSSPVLQPLSPVLAMPGAAGALRTLAAHHPRLHQSVLTGNIRPLAELKLGAAGLGELLDFDVGAYGDAHEMRAELVDVARRAAQAAYGATFPGRSTVLVGDTPLDVAAALASGARVVAVASGSYSAAELAVAGAHAVLPDLTDADQVLAAVAAR
jgi:phosphoglycolate phosphatase